MTASLAAEIATRHAVKHPHRKQHHIRNRSEKTATDPVEHHQQVVEQAGKWVSQTFYGQMLKQMRDSPFKSDKFDGGRGGQAYHEMFDQKLSDKMARGAGKKLVESLAKKMEHARPDPQQMAVKQAAARRAYQVRLDAQPRELQ